MSRQNDAAIPVLISALSIIEKKSGNTLNVHQYGNRLIFGVAIQKNTLPKLKRLN